MKRVLTLLVAALLVTSAAGPASAALFTDSQDDDPPVITYGSEGHPSYVLTFSNGSYGDLTRWANNSELRAVQSVDNQTNVAVVSTPKWDATGISFTAIPASSASVSTYASGVRLESVSWVESMGINYRLSLNPVENPVNASDYTPPEKLFGVGSYDMPTDGIAFDGEANQTTMQESRAALGGDNTTASSNGYSRPLAIIDTGVNTANGAVFGNGTSGSPIRVSHASKNAIENTTVSESGLSTISDGNSHGTWVASAAAANTSNDVHDGVAPDAQLLIMKALADDGSGSTADIARSIRYAADQNASVISMSLGSPLYSEALADAVTYAADQDSLVIVAAGNSRLTRSPGIGSPADTESVIAVGATTGDEPMNAESAYFSQYTGAQASDGELGNDETVDVAAPGMNTTARVVTESGVITNETLSGTSMATPMVAAGAYVARATNQDWSVSEARSAVEAATRPVPAAGTREVGGGMFAADYAVAGESGASQSDRMTDAAVTRNEVYGHVGGSNWLDGLNGLVGVAG